MNIAIYYSSITGNTKKLAMYIKEQLGEGASIYATQSATELVPADLYIIAFWCRRSSLDDHSIILLEKLKNKRIIAVGTIGGDAYGAYGQRVINNVTNMINVHNQALGVYVCQGSIDLKRSERRLRLPDSNPHHIDMEKYQKHVRTQGHPDSEDLLRIWNHIKSSL